MEITEPEIRREDILILQDSDFNPQNVCIATGAAGGIGRATAVAAAANNLTCVGLDINEQGGKENANRLSFEARLERPVTGRLFISLGSQYIRDRFAGYDYRISAGPGLGYDILRGESHELKASVSGLYYFEQYATSGEEKIDYASIAAALGYQWRIRKNVVLNLKGDYAGALEESDTYFMTQESGVEVAVSETISLGVKFLLRYQNLPPALEIKKTDTSFLTSLILNL